MTPQELASFTTGSIIIFVLWIWPMIITYRVTKRKNRSYKLWTFGAFFFGWLIAIISLLLEKRERSVNY